MPTLTLRTKIVFLGSMVGALLAVTAAVSTYVFARQYVVQQRVDATVSQVGAASRLVSASLVSNIGPLEALLAGSQLLPGSRAALFTGGEWFVSGVGLSQADLPASLLLKLGDGVAARQIGTLRAEAIVAVGYPIAARPDTWFIGVVSLQETTRALAVFRGALAVGIGLGTLGGGFIGWRLSRRIMEPLHIIGDTAEAIANGDVSKRIKEPREPDLVRISRAFNEMADSQAIRLEREARFGATVSHELKSPLTVIKAAADLISARRSELPARVQMGCDLLNVQIEEFGNILDDLIEMSRYQAGTFEPQLEIRSMKKLVETMAIRHGLDLGLLEVADAQVEVDVRRLEQVFINLKRNADLYANGLAMIRGATAGDAYVLHFDDAGPGVAPSDRHRVFDPFVRGPRHSALPGSGLGLAITREHLRAMGADIVLEASPESGARVSLTLRVSDSDEYSLTEGDQE